VSEIEHRHRPLEDDDRWLAWYEIRLDDGTPVLAHVSCSSAAARMAEQISLALAETAERGRGSVLLTIRLDGDDPALPVHEFEYEDPLLA
jgi:hypothetical protein